MGTDSQPLVTTPSSLIPSLPNAPCSLTFQASQSQRLFLTLLSFPPLHAVQAQLRLTFFQLSDKPVTQVIASFPTGSNRIR